MESHTLNTNQPIDIAYSKRHIASELRGAVSKHQRHGSTHAEMIAEIDAITEQAANLGLCRHAWESDPAFEPRGSIVGETRGRKPKAYIPGTDSIGRI